MFPTTAEAGPSNGGNRFVLAPPISPTFNARASLSIVEESDEEWDESEDELDQGEADLVERFPSTPNPNHPHPLTPPRPLRLSLDSLQRHQQLTPSTHTSSYRRNHSSSPSAQGRSSTSEIPPAPTSPNGESRSRVSLDATPLPSSMSEFESISEDPSLPPLRSALMRESSYRQDEEEPQIGSRIPQRTNSKKRARFLLEAPSMTRSDQGTSSDTHVSRRSYMSAFAGDDATETYADTFSGPVDETIRSVPGVIGLGEGWAGGPQRKEGRKWFKRRPTAEDEDPLALWDSDGGDTHGDRDSTTSPLKNMWNMSKRNLFGGSTPALHEHEGECSDTPGGERSPSRLRGLLNNLSRSTLTSPHPDNSSHFSIKPKSNRLSLGSLSTSDLTLTGQKSKPAIQPSPSMSILQLANSAPRKHRQYSTSSYARSEGDLTTAVDPAAIIPQRSSSLTRRQKRQGLPPPWRPNSLLVDGRPQTPYIPEVDEFTRESTPSPSPGTPQMNEDASSLSSSRGHTLTRTATFGLEDIASEQRIDEEQHEDDKVTMPDAQAHARSWPTTPSPEVKGEASRDTATTPRPASPRQKPSLGKRGVSLWRKMRNVLPMSLLRTESDPATHMRNSQTLRTPGTSTNPSTRSASTSISSDNSTMSSLATAAKHRQRSSWMARSSSLAHRLSRLTEQDEVDLTGNGPSASDDRANLTDGAPSHLDQRVDGEKKGRAHHRRRSTNLAILTMGNRRSAKPHSLENMRRVPASASVPALHRYQPSDLNLHVELDGEELGLDDILDQRKRDNIIQKIQLASPPTREDALQATTAALVGVGTQPATSGPSRPTHLKIASEPIATVMGGDELRHRRNRRNSLPTSIKSTEVPVTRGGVGARRPSITSVTSSPASTLTTPRHPAELATFLHALTFVESGHSDHLAPPSPSRSGSRAGADAKDRPVVGIYNYPWDASAASLHSATQASGLQVPKRHSTTTNRLSIDSDVTQPSLYDTGEVIESRAVRVDSLSDMHKHASVVRLDELARGLA